MRCEACDGTGESEKWNQSSGVYHDCSCPHCDGTGKTTQDPWEPEHGLKRDDPGGSMNEGDNARCSDCGAPLKRHYMLGMPTQGFEPHECTWQKPQGCSCNSKNSPDPGCRVHGMYGTGE